jgi:cytochrome c-type biogenesis protein CcmI
VTLYLGVALVTAAVLLFLLQPVVRGIHASLERQDDELTDTEARKRIALLALRDVEYDFLAGKLDEHDYRALKSELTAEALAALEADEADVADKADGGGEGALAVGAESVAADDLEEEIARIRSGLRSGLVCASCGFTNDEGSRFCSACGHALGGRVAS